MRWGVCAKVKFSYKTLNQNENKVGKTKMKFRFRES